MKCNLCHLRKRLAHIKTVHNQKISTSIKLRLRGFNLLDIACRISLTSAKHGHFAEI